MEMQSLCRGHSSPILSSLNRSSLSHHPVISSNHVLLRQQRFQLGTPSKVYMISGLKKNFKGSSFRSLNKAPTVCSSNSESDANSKPLRRKSSDAPNRIFNRVEPLGGKSGSISFHGLTHQLVEERKLVSAPFEEGKGTILWVLAPTVLISSLIFPQFFLGPVIAVLFQEETLVEIMCSVSFEAIFYIGLSMFLSLTDRVQRPYLEFSAKRWGLITGLKGYLTSAFFTMGFKVVAPLIAVYVAWPVLGVQAIVAVAPFLVGCAAQLAFEIRLEKRGSSCWPLVPIIFEVYRLYQLTRAAHFVQMLLIGMKDAISSPPLIERRTALVGMVVTFQVLAVITLWSLMTFLIRLFPSRPVAENY